MKKLLLALLLAFSASSYAQWGGLYIQKPATASGAGSGTVTSVGWTGGIVSIANPTTTPAFTIAGTSGGIPYFSGASTWASSAALAANALLIGGGAGVAPASTTTGAGVLTALGNATNGAGGFIVTDGTATLTNKTYDTAGTGNVFKINGNSFVNTNCDATHFVRGDGTCQTVSASAALSSISAATGANTIASGNFTGQVWNWANTTDSTIAFTLGETSAATNGTSTSGIPNQVLFKLTTAAASTQSPLSVYSRATHVFSVSPSAAQVLIADGVVGNPTIAFASETNTGIYKITGSTWGVSASGTRSFQVSNTSAGFLDGTGAAPSITSISTGTSGLFFSGASILGVAVNTVENSRFIAGVLQSSKGSADAVAFALNFRKARGTVASPTVITTGDALATESGYGYVGGTNTYLEAARIEFDSTGTITDATTGIGGIIKFMTTKQGTDSAVQEGMRISGGSTPQVTLQVGSAATPSLTFSGATNSGFFSVAGSASIAGSGAELLRAVSSQVLVLAGAGNLPSIGNLTNASGIFFPGAVGFSDGTKEIARFVGGANTNELLMVGMLQANLGTPANGSIAYCSDCTIANPCAGGGNGALAKRLNGAWVCN